MSIRFFILSLFVCVVVAVRGYAVVPPNETISLTSQVTNQIVVSPVCEEPSKASSGVPPKKGEVSQKFVTGKGIVKYLWKIIAPLFVAIGVVIDFCTKHSLCKLGKWVFGLIAYLLGYRKTEATKSRDSSQKISIENMGNGNNLTIINNVVPSHKDEVDAVDNKSLKQESTKEELHEERIKVEDFKPFCKIKARGSSLVQIVEEYMETVESIRATCPKKFIPICVIDDKDGDLYVNGLRDLGYANVTVFPKCPSYSELRAFAIIFFDVRGVGNATGKDGLTLAVQFKKEHDSKKVGVRSAFLQHITSEERSKLDFVIEKKRDLCEQVAPELAKALEEVGNPRVMWKKIRKSRIDSTPIAQLALLEHKYVKAIQALSRETDTLPGDWMAQVNSLMNEEIF